MGLLTRHAAEVPPPLFLLLLAPALGLAAAVLVCACLLALKWALQWALSDRVKSTAGAVTSGAAFRRPFPGPRVHASVCLGNLFVRQYMTMSSHPDHVGNPLRRRLALGAGAAGLLVFAGCAPGKPLRIGFLGGLTGRVSDLGIGGRNGTQLAVDDLNAAGGIDGLLFELLGRDDEQNIALSRTRLQELFDSGVVWVVGPMTSPVAASILPLANERAVPLISPLAGAPEFSGRKDAFFRVVASSVVSAQQMADAMLKRGLRRLVTVSDLRNAVFTQGWARALSERFVAGGGTALPALEFEAGPDLILLDMHLPDMGGEAVAAALRADDRLCRTPVVVVSADATRMQIDTMRQFGVQACLTKPLELAETLRVIDLMLDGTGTTDCGR